MGHAGSAGLQGTLCAQGCVAAQEELLQGHGPRKAYTEQMRSVVQMLEPREGAPPCGQPGTQEMPSFPSSSGAPVFPGSEACLGCVGEHTWTGRAAAGGWEICRHS